MDSASWHLQISKQWQIVNTDKKNWEGIQGRDVMCFASGQIAQ